MAAAILLLVPAPLLAQFAHPELKSGSRHVQKLMIMPIQVQLTKLGMKGSELMTEESMQAQKSLTPVLAGIFRQQGYRVDEATVSPAALETDADLRYTVDDLQKKFDDVLKIMKHKAGDVRKGRFSLGDNVTKLAAGENVDALLFVRASGRLLTGGRKAYSLLVNPLCWDNITMYIGLVDAQTGNVLYFAVPQWLPNPASDPAHSAKSVREAFKNFFKASPASAAPSKTQAQSTTPADL